MACVRDVVLAWARHHVGRETIDRSGAASVWRVGVGRGHHWAAERTADEGLRAPSHGECAGIDVAIDSPAFVIVHAAHVDPHDELIIGSASERDGGEVLRGGRGHCSGAQDELRGAVDLRDRGVVAHAETDDGHTLAQAGGAGAIHGGAPEGRRAACEIHPSGQVQVTAAVSDQRRRIHEGHDVGSRDGLRIVAAGAVTTNAANLRLAIHLTTEIHHRPAKASHRVGRLRCPIRVRRVYRCRANGVVVVAPAPVVMAAIRVQRLTRCAIRLDVAIDRIAVERPSQRLVIAQRSAKAGREMRRDDVIVVIIRQAAMPAVVIQLADFIGHPALIVRRVENGDAIRCERDGTALEVIRRRARREDQCRRCGRCWCKRQTPVVRLLVA